MASPTTQPLRTFARAGGHCFVSGCALKQVHINDATQRIGTVAHPRSSELHCRTDFIGEAQRLLITFLLKFGRPRARSMSDDSSGKSERAARREVSRFSSLPSLTSSSSFVSQNKNEAFFLFASSIYLFFCSFPPVIPYSPVQEWWRASTVPYHG